MVSVKQSSVVLCLAVNSDNREVNGEAQWYNQQVMQLLYENRIPYDICFLSEMALHPKLEIELEVWVGLDEIRNHIGDLLDYFADDSLVKAKCTNG